MASPLTLLTRATSALTNGTHRPSGILKIACATQQLCPSRQGSSNTAAVSRLNRIHYPRTYPTLLVFPDGSTITVRYHEPRRIIKLPVDFSKLTEEQKRLLLANRKPKQKLEVMEDFDEAFDVDSYSKYWKK